VAELCVGDAWVGSVFAEGGREGVEMILLLAEDLAEVFAEGELVEQVRLLDAAAIVADGLFLVFEIEAQHVFGLVAGLDGLVGDGGHAAEKIDPVAELERVAELFLGVDFELIGDVHVSRSFEDLRVVDVGDDGLKLALEIFVEEIDHLLACEVLLRIFVLVCHVEHVSLSDLFIANAFALTLIEMRWEEMEWPGEGAIAGALGRHLTELRRAYGRGQKENL
jgi:hypothetical protein